MRAFEARVLRSRGVEGADFGQVPTKESKSLQAIVKVNKRKPFRSLERESAPQPGTPGCGGHEAHGPLSSS